MSHNVCYLNKIRPERSTRLILDDGTVNVHVGDIVEYRRTFKDGKRCSPYKEYCLVRYVGDYILDLVCLGDTRINPSRFYFVDLRDVNRQLTLVNDACVCNGTLVSVGDIVNEVDTLNIDFDWRVVKIVRGRIYCFPVEHGLVPRVVVAFKPSDIVLKEKKEK